MILFYKIVVLLFHANKMIIFKNSKKYYTENVLNNSIL